MIQSFFVGIPSNTPPEDRILLETFRDLAIANFGSIYANPGARVVLQLNRRAMEEAHRVLRFLKEQEHLGPGDVERVLRTLRELTMIVARGAR